MDPAISQTTSTSLFHVVAMPYPGRGHINPMMNLCKLLSSKRSDFLITFVVTEEWLGFINTDPKPANIHYATIPNVIPSEVGRAKDFLGFLEAVHKKMMHPFEQLLDRLEPPVDVIIFDTYLDWITKVGNQRGIPVASLWTMSATVFSIFHHFELVRQNRHFPVDLSERGEEIVDYIPGLPAIRLADFPTLFYGKGRQCLPRALDSVSLVSKAQYLLFTSVHELEASVFDALNPEFPFPVYPIGPSIPYFEPENIGYHHGNGSSPNYMKWLDSQPKASVLYISMGSFLSVSTAQLDEIVAGVRDSGVRFLWVWQGEITDLFQDCCGELGLFVPWCNQLKVLNHPSVGGFWTHCGFNSTLEAVYAGVPMLTSPIFWDQVPNSKAIVEDWKIGWRAKKNVASENVIKREEIAKLIQNLMDQESSGVKEMKKRAIELKEVCRAATAKRGSSDSNLDSFIRHITES